MGFIKPDLPPVEPTTFLQKPLMERMKVLALNWAENGYGAPKMVHTIYLVKLVVLYALGGVLVATWTSGQSPWDVAGWWDQPIVYQKFILWTVLLETIGIAGSWGPLAGKTKPMTGGIRFWARPGTIRLRPWRRVPFTAGDRRTWFDVVLYLALIAAVAVPLVLPGVVTDSLSAALPGNTSGLVDPVLLVPAIVLLVLNGLRDKTIFLGARGEQYLPALVFFAALPFVDMIIALKLLIVVVWVGAGVSKFGKHFSNVVPPMVSNSPGIPFTWFKRAHYRDFPRDLRPSRFADLPSAAATPRSPPPSGRSTPDGCPSGRSCWSDSSTWPTSNGPSATSIHCGHTRRCRTAIPATPPRRSSPRSNGSPPASGTGSSGGRCARQRRWPRTTRTTSAETSSPAPRPLATWCSARAPPSRRTRSGSPACTSARRRPHPAPARTACAAPTRPRRRCVTCAGTGDPVVIGWG